MNYQVFIQSNSVKHFVASIVGIPNLSVEATTEEDAIVKVKLALEQQLAKGKFVTINIDQPTAMTSSRSQTIEPIQYGGRCAEDPTFDDWMDKLALIRQEANALDDAV
jgi:hypothetical protein